MSIQTYNLGSTVLIELEYKKRQPFGTTAYFDPSTLPTVTITDEHGTVVVNADNTTKSDTGKYYYFCQTETTWHPGDYKIKTTPTDGVYNDVEITDPEENEGFRLE